MNRTNPDTNDEEKINMELNTESEKVLFGGLRLQKIRKPKKQKEITLYEAYVDDNSALKPKSTRRERLKYFKRLISKNKGSRPIPPNYKGWSSRFVQSDVDIGSYSTITILFIRFIVSYWWDMLYFSLLLLWLIVMVLVEDHILSYITIIPPSYLKVDGSLLLLPLVAMTCSQIVPCLGITFLMYR
jgi:hypothetical protein